MTCPSCGYDLTQKHGVHSCSACPAKYTECRYCAELLPLCSCETWGCNGEADHEYDCRLEGLANAHAYYTESK